MTDKKIESFKIGDSHRPGMSKPVESTSTKLASSKRPEAFSVGFARIEGLLDREDPAQVGASLSEILKNLNDLGEKAQSNKEKLAVKRATAAVERAVDLMDYLFQTKAAMEKNL